MTPRNIVVRAEVFWTNPLFKHARSVVIWKPISSWRGPGSVVGIATGYGLNGPGIESWRGHDFSPVQTGPGANPASCKMGTGSFPGVKSGRGVTLTLHPLLVPWSRKSRAIPLLPYGPYGLYRASVPVQRCTLPLRYIWIIISTCSCSGMEWILLPQDIVRRSPPANSNEPSGSVKCREFLDYLKDCEGRSVSKVP
jgi:hypothetical protein